MAKNPRLIDISGEKFGLWTVIEKAGNTKGGGAVWTCRCACGSSKEVIGGDLRAGKSTSCGCASRARIGERARTHGGSGTRLYEIWKGMRARCQRQGHPQFPDYGGRGISICAEWQDFGSFRDWAEKNGYSDDLSIEREDVNGDYSPQNCVWADAAVQSANRRFTLKRDDGVLWLHVARQNGIKEKTYHSRVYKQGWSHEKAATKPVRR